MKTYNPWLVLALNLVLNSGNTVFNPVLADEQPFVESNANIKNWVVEAENLREQGDLISAQQKLDSALQQADNQSMQPLDFAAVELANGYNLLLLNQREAAEQRLKSAYSKTGDTGYLHALAGQYLAYWYLSNLENEAALTHINNGLAAISSGGHDDLALSLELMRLGLNNEPAQQQAETVLTIAKRIKPLPANTIKAKLSLKMVQKVLELSASQATAPMLTELQQQSYQLLSELLSLKDGVSRGRIQADAAGKLAQLYRLQLRNEDALLLTEQAINLAHDGKDHVLLAQLQAQLGDIFIVLGDKERAGAAYRHAVDDLYAVRADMPINLPDGGSVLTTIIEPIYRRHVDLLLQTSPNDNTASSRLIIDQAIDSMEAIKQADMQDFFLGRCSVSPENNQDGKFQTPPEAATVYPILLEDRIELIVKFEQNSIRHTIKVPLQTVQDQTSALVEALHNGKDYRKSSKQLYEWLIQPIQADLQQANIHTIVFVPDRFLRAMPLSALTDGKLFVVEQYAIVTLPSIALQNTGNRKINQAARTLLAGLSKPNVAVIDRLPNNFFEKLSGQKVERDALIEELSLPSVEQEISTIAETNNSTKLLNDQFTVSALKSDIETGKYNKIHIASHGFFGRNAKDSFIMAYDQNITLLDFKNSLEEDNLKREPIELLTLSACKTAEGDDRMLLGFSGLAVKSNVLSAVGSLWSINDDATMAFMKYFYAGLNQSLNKAQAMRAAQMMMIKDKKFKHPFFWSPFILIGRWQ